MIAEISTGFIAALCTFFVIRAIRWFVKRRKGRYKAIFKKIIQKDYENYMIGYKREPLSRYLITDQQHEHFTARDLNKLEKMYDKVFQEFLHRIQEEQNMKEAIHTINTERRTRTEVARSLGAE